MIALAVPLILLSTLAQTPAPPAKHAPAPRDLVARALTAMGGEPAVRGVRNVTVTYYLASFGLGQEETPQSPARATLTTGTQTIDYAAGRQLAVTEVRNPAGTVNKVRRVIAGGIGMTEANGAQTPDAPLAVATVERNQRRLPDRILLAAFDNPTSLHSLPARTWRGESVAGVHYVSALDTLDVYFDRRSGLPVLIETTTDDPVLGDRRTLVAYTRWQDAGGVLSPREWDVDVNGRLQNAWVFTAVTTNGMLADSLFVIPDSIKAKAQPSDPTPPPIVVSLVELAPHVWRAEGGTHHSLIVDQGTRLVVAEAPLSAQRMEALLDTLRSRFPGKPVGLVINTHHHWDHAGGLRTVLAAGVPIVTHARNVSFVRSIGTARKTIRPDALSRSGHPSGSTITSVEDSLVVGSGATRVVAYRLPSAHVEGLLAVYVPEAKILFQSDVVNAAPTPPAAGSAELIKFVKARGIAVERVAGGHGVVLPWADVERAATPPASAP
ncbi:MAG TPA: MBL fold metallo-hydrolase [Gemmatimonadales bacterium]|nr:MBL fold metallo-hydrolase [Gemmatimonadales bacterium]